MKCYRLNKTVRELTNKQVVMVVDALSGDEYSLDELESLGFCLDDGIFISENLFYGRFFDKRIYDATPCEELCKKYVDFYEGAKAICENKCHKPNCPLFDAERRICYLDESQYSHCKRLIEGVCFVDDYDDNIYSIAKRLLGEEE